MLIVVLTSLFVVSLRPQPHLSETMARAVRLGFDTLLGALAVGAAMIAAGMVLVYSGDQRGAYAAGGSLKLAHFAAMHGVAILPGLAWLGAFASWPEDRLQRVVALGSAGYLTVVIAIVVALVTGAAVPR